MKSFSIIVALNEKNGIGLNNKIPWKCPEDLRWFRYITKNNIVVMGRKTWESLSHRPLKDRINIVLSRNKIENLPENTYCFDSLEKALSYEKEDKKIFVIGGSEIYQQASQLKCNKIYLTNINIGTILSYCHMVVQTPDNGLALMDGLNFLLVEV